MFFHAPLFMLTLSLSIHSMEWRLYPFQNLLEPSEKERKQASVPLVSEKQNIAVNLMPSRQFPLQGGPKKPQFEVMELFYPRPLG